MTIGIYQIRIPAYSNKTYTGRSVEVEKRWHRHEAELKKGTHHNKKLQKVFNRFKDRVNFSLEFSLITECSETDLSSLEQTICDLVPRSLQFNVFAGTDDYWKKCDYSHR
jgi:GIY-YIG catalytic domain